MITAAFVPRRSFGRFAVARSTNLQSLHQLVICAPDQASKLLGRAPTLCMQTGTLSVSVLPHFVCKRAHCPFPFCNLSAVRIFSCTSSQVKNLCCGSCVCADQIHLGLKEHKEPLNCTSYAEHVHNICSEIQIDKIPLSPMTTMHVTVRGSHE